MKEYLKQLLSESTAASISRVLATVCYITANILALVHIWSSKDLVTMVATLLSAGTVLKIGGKAMEG